MSGGNSQEIQYEQMETSDTGIDFTQAFTQMEPVIASVLGNMKQWSAFNRQTDNPRIGGVCISDEMNIVLMSKEQYGKILEETKIPNVMTIREDIVRVREAMTGHNPKSPIILEPQELEKFCREKCNAPTLFDSIFKTLEHPSSKRINETNQQRTVTIIYTMVYAQSQKCDWFQKMTGLYLQKHGLTDKGFEALRREGTTVSSKTMRNFSKTKVSEHQNIVKKFIDEAIEKSEFMILMIDDYTNIHSLQRPKDPSNPTNVARMATILLKKFPNINIIPRLSNQMDNLHYPGGINIQLITAKLAEQMPLLGETFVDVMHNWIKVQFFDPETERHRLFIHDYQEQEPIRKMGTMESCRRTDCKEMPLKTYQNFCEAIEHAMNSGLSQYLEKFIFPMPAD